MMMMTIRSQVVFKRNRYKNLYKFDTSIFRMEIVGHSSNDTDIWSLIWQKEEKMECSEAEKEESEEEEEDEEEEDAAPSQTLTLGSMLATLAAAENAPKDESADKKKENGKEETGPWVWPQPFKPKPLTKRQRKQVRWRKLLLIFTNFNNASVWPIVRLSARVPQ